jgi:hypothetical protein
MWAAGFIRDTERRKQIMSTWFSDICDAYEEAFNQAVEDEMQRRCAIYI